jgi:hypothetical protein
VMGFGSLKDEDLVVDLVRSLLLFFWVRELISWYKEFRFFLIIF